MSLFGSWHNTERFAALSLTQQPPNVLKILSQHYLKCPPAFQLKEGQMRAYTSVCNLVFFYPSGVWSEREGTFPVLLSGQGLLSSIIFLFPLDRLCSLGLSFFSLHLAWPKNSSSVNEPVMVSLQLDTAFSHLGWESQWGLSRSH